MVVSNVVCVPVTFKLPVIVVLALSSIPPVPLGSKVISAFEGEIIVEPTKEKSPTDTVANDNVPDPSVVMNCPAEPSDVGYAKPDSCTVPEPDPVNIKSSFEFLAVIILSLMRG